MTEQLLDSAQVSASFQHVGGKGMPQYVGRDALEGRNAQYMCIYDAGYAAAVDALAAGIQEEWAVTGRFTAVCQVFTDSGDSPAAYRHDPFLAAFAHHPDHAPGKIQFCNVEPGHLRH